MADDGDTVDLRAWCDWPLRSADVLHLRDHVRLAPDSRAAQRDMDTGTIIVLGRQVHVQLDVPIGAPPVMCLIDYHRVQKQER